MLVYRGVCDERDRRKNVIKFDITLFHGVILRHKNLTKMKQIISLILIVIGLFSVNTVKADDGRGGDSTSLNFHQKRPVHNGDNPANQPRKPAYVPIYGEVCSDIILIWGVQQGKADIEIIDTKGTISVSDTFVLTEGFSYSLTCEPENTITIVVKVNGIEYLSEFTMEE